MRSGDPGPDLPCRMLRVGPDLLFTSQEACQQRSPAVEGQPQDAVGLDATHHQLGGDHRTSSLSYFCTSIRIRHKAVRDKRLPISAGDSVTAARRTSAASGPTISGSRIFASAYNGTSAGQHADGPDRFGLRPSQQWRHWFG